jgi:hypothetical protein
MTSLSQGEQTMSVPKMLKVPVSFIATCLVMASQAAMAHAQHPNFAAKMNVPFAFQTSSGQHFGPGIYTIRMTGQAATLIQGSKSSGLAAALLACDSLPSAEGKAVFKHYGDRYFLQSISVAGTPSRLLFAASKAERQAQNAAIKTSSETEVAVLGVGR